ncbi:uracil-DNA glycosylase family protein [Enterococcus saccharolyticus]|uniref:Uracil-DNA glycosylase-like domain-containing protein n=1 Tax=Enterococcus saccharolyticus subsp. saccharolyticus ATCC 43076 TaxID=1139996 RepID=S0JSU5_9ENTE|nr:uracil-DNA glycosylase family protein [Enterococcus saccharolyticus]EOT30001.1 hypothetical protein OMQ_00693 [Enterococcus saccharolyticus subsp. saccharolyticus ATCC 43076]EOT80547.1 hypothetical protein I572_01074 [Enterococcus saccharolyticus subsp. saccharolyticus ATCC 43076]
MEQTFEEYIQELRNCTLCKDRLTPAPIFLGNQQSKIVHISQAPSHNVAITQKPFNDASGKKLRETWYQISDELFYNPDNFCFTSIGLCYPGKTKNGGDKQPPAICAKTWLHRTLSWVDNELYILIGAKAANHFFKGQDFADLVFRDQEINGKKALVLPHPSPLNIKWFKNHPEFYQTRVGEIRAEIQMVLEK